MTPDEIKEFVAANYSDVVCKPLDRGWSFWYERVETGPGFTRRLARVKWRSRGGIEFKRGVTSFLQDRTVREKIKNREELRRVIDEEIQLWNEALFLPRCSASKD
jgi:hypothetical protein